MDVGVFGPMKRKMGEVARQLNMVDEQCTINRGEFVVVFKHVLDHGVPKNIIKHAWKKSGLFPFNPDAIDKIHIIPLSLAPSESEDEQEAEVSSSTIDYKR